MLGVILMRNSIECSWNHSIECVDVIKMCCACKIILSRCPLCPSLAPNPPPLLQGIFFVTCPFVQTVVIGPNIASAEAGTRLVGLKSKGLISEHSWKCTAGGSPDTDDRNGPACELFTLPHLL